MAFAQDIEALGSASVNVLPDKVHSSEEAWAVLDFSDRSQLSACYWRLIADGRAQVSCFDHLHQYGLPERIDAVQALRSALTGRRRQAMRLDVETGDLPLVFDGAVQLQVFRFTGYEAWELTFPDGSRAYSTDALSCDLRDRRADAIHAVKAP